MPTHQKPNEPSDSAACSPLLPLDSKKFHDTDFLSMDFRTCCLARQLILNESALKDHRHWLELNDPYVTRVFAMLRSDGVDNPETQNLAAVALLAKECARLRRLVP